MAMSFFGKSDSVKTDAAPPCYPLGQQVHAYWLALCADGQPPLRQAIDPRGIEAALAQTFIAEQIAPGVARMRVAGMGLADILGMDLRGMPISCLIDPPCRDQMAAAVSAVTQMRQVVTLDLSAAGGLGRPLLKARLVMMPLRDDTGGICILGCLDIIGEIGRAPRRLMIEASRNASHNGAAQPLRRVAAPLGHAEPKIAFEVQPTKSSRSYLQLVKS